MAQPRRFHSEALQYLWDRSIGTDPVGIAEFEQNLVNMEVAQRIYDLRTKAGLTQRELALDRTGLGCRAASRSG